ncbi:MAG: hypothetical protein H7Y02_04170 [Candidatus Obscuribacterales bacterium]|nr:hypothetical protein [Steroidobacteraceae bacterium]
MQRTWGHCLVVVVIASGIDCGQAGERVGGSVGVARDYVYRGLSQSEGKVVIQGGAHVRPARDWQVGIWASTVEHKYDPGTAIELDSFVSYSHALTADWQWRSSFTHYEFVKDDSPLGYDYDELSTSIAYQSRVSLAVAWIPNAARYRYKQTAARASAYALDVNWTQPLFRDVSAVVGAGYYDVSALYATGYGYWHVGIASPVGPVDLELLHIDTQDRAVLMYGYALAGPRWSASARWRF